MFSCLQQVLLDGSNTQVDCGTTDLRETMGEDCVHLDISACEACSIQIPEKTYFSLLQEEGTCIFYCRQKNREREKEKIFKSIFQ